LLGGATYRKHKVVGIRGKDDVGRDLLGVRNFSGLWYGGE